MGKQGLSAPEQQEQNQQDRRGDAKQPGSGPGKIFQTVHLIVQAEGVIDCVYDYTQNEPL